MKLSNFLILASFLKIKKAFVYNFFFNMNLFILNLQFKSENDFMSSFDFHNLRPPEVLTVSILLVQLKATVVTC